jgi:hypothetical protein
MIHALGFIPGLYKKANDKQLSPVVAFGRILPSSKEMMQILGTLLFVMFGWLFFRITNLNDAFAILNKIVSTSLFNTPHFWSENADLLKLAHLLFFTIFCFGCEWWSRQTDSSVFFMNRINSKFLRYILYIGLIFLCVGFKGENVEFIYFAF